MNTFPIVFHSNLSWSIKMYIRTYFPNESMVFLVIFINTMEPYTDAISSIDFPELFVHPHTIFTRFHSIDSPSNRQTRACEFYINSVRNESKPYRSSPGFNTFSLRRVALFTIGRDRNSTCTFEPLGFQKVENRKVVGLWFSAKLQNKFFEILIFFRGILGVS